MLHRDTERGFEQRLKHVAAAVDLPADIVALRDRAKAFNRAPDRPILDRLVRALIDDTDADIDLLWAAALAETVGAHNDLREAVRTAMNREARILYADHAATIYGAIAAQFDTAAGKLTACHDAVDVEAPAETAVDMPEKSRKLWREAQTHAAELGRLLVSLKAAAVLAGVCGDHAENDLALAVDPTDLDRRALWAAWDTETREAVAQRSLAAGAVFTTAPATRSRCGRWSAVLRLGAQLRACPPDEFPDYRRPAAMVEVVENTAAGPRRDYVDPETHTPPERPRITAPRVRVR